MSTVPSASRESSDTGDDRLEDIVAAIDERTAAGIAAALSRLVTSGRLPIDARLPTVRTLARELGASPSTVSAAWGALARQGLIESRGRLGTFVLPTHDGRQRYSRMSGEQPANFRLDLSTGTPDPGLLPDLGPALQRIGRRAQVSNYHDEHVLPELQAHVRATWPYPPETVAIVDGALDALDRLVLAMVRFGDHVLVENPTFPAVLDLLDQRGARAVPVAVDEQGPLPGSVADGLALDPTVFVLQPRAQNPTGSSLTATRVRALARVLRGRPVVIIEDDHAGDIATTPDLSLGRHLPEQTVRIRSYSKSHGPDLRIAALAGPAELIDPVSRRRYLGSGWSSRLLQGLLIDLLNDPQAQADIARARTTYGRRREALRTALAARGVRSSAGSGVNLWVEVADEQAALVSLAAAGVRASPGSPFLVEPLATQHLRLTTGHLKDGVAELADQVADAARMQRMTVVHRRPGNGVATTVAR